VSDSTAWPPERFYWGVLEETGWNRAGILPEALRPMLEEELPREVSDLHAVCVPMADGALAVCAVDRADLEHVPGGTLSLTPQSVPDFLDARADASQFALLVGEFEPRPVRAARVRRHVAAAAVLVACSLLVAFGLQRRMNYWESVVSSTRIVATELIDKVSLVLAPGSNHRRQLDDEIDRLRRLESAFTRETLPVDAAAPLAAMLRVWPSAVPNKVQAIAVNPSGMTISVLVEGDVSPFLRAFRTPAGWLLDEPRLTAAGNVTRLTLQVRSVAEATP